jgi:hypothetical protein
MRALPSVVIAGLHAPRPAVALEGDGMVVELALRRCARACAEREGVTDLLDALASQLPETLLVETLQKTDVPADADLALRSLAPKDPTLELRDASTQSALRAFAALAAMADHLSDDAYDDPRVR